MKTSSDHILTSHAGSLPRPDALIEAYRAREAGEVASDRAIEDSLRVSVSEVVRRQHDLGIDIPGDGEYGKSMGHRVNYGAWWRYSFLRLGGLDMGGPGLYEMPARRSRAGEVVLTSFADRRDRMRFAAAYADPDSGITTGPRPANHPVCVAPLTYTGQEAIAADIARFKAALELLDYMQSKGGVWFARLDEVCNHVQKLIAEQRWVPRTETLPVYTSPLPEFAKQK